MAIPAVDDLAGTLAKFEDNLSTIVLLAIVSRISFRACRTALALTLD